MDFLLAEKAGVGFGDGKCGFASSIISVPGRPTLDRRMVEVEQQLACLQRDVDAVRGSSRWHGMAPPCERNRNRNSRRWS